jgi:hypothetical protein
MEPAHRKGDFVTPAVANETELVTKSPVMMGRRVASLCPPPSLRVGYERGERLYTLLFKKTRCLFAGSRQRSYSTCHFCQWLPGEHKVNNFALKDTDGRTVKLSQSKGKVIVLVFSAAF